MDCMLLFKLQVSWIRKRDLHILTAGITVYTSDQRFQVGGGEHDILSGLIYTVLLIAF